MINIDIISGFLGAGKTTFVNLLLRYYMNLGLRPVYIVNEFGQTGVDAEIIKSDGFEAVEIEGGCICCTLKDDIAATITKVIDTLAPTNIVFEPSGIFIFDNFFEILNQPDIAIKCNLGNVITVVDSVNFSFSKAVYGNFIYNQIKNAGTILLSKMEKSKYTTDELICDIKNINPDAFIMSKLWDDFNEADFELLLNQKKSPDINHNAHSHSQLNSFTVKIDRSFTQDKVDLFIASCQSGMFGDLCRVKGIIKTESFNLLLNISMEDDALKKFKGAAEYTMTFIGQSVNKTEILKFLKEK